MDAQAAEDCESLKNGNLAISELNAVRMDVDEDSDDVFLRVLDRHAENALRVLRVLATYHVLVLGMLSEPLSRIVDI